MWYFSSSFFRIQENEGIEILEFCSLVTKSLPATFPQCHLSYHYSMAKVHRKLFYSCKSYSTLLSTDVLSFLTLCIMLHYPVQSICAL